MTDSSIISTRVDAIVLVARAGKTKRDVIRRVTRKLADLNAPIVGLVLNAMVAPRAASAYYYPYAYYGYGRKYEGSSEANS